jgi:hypothetical protein
MYVCMYVCLYVRMYVCMYVCMHACLLAFGHLPTLLAHFTWHTTSKCMHFPARDRPSAGQHRTAWCNGGLHGQIACGAKMHAFSTSTLASQLTNQTYHRIYPCHTHVTLSSFVYLKLKCVHFSYWRHFSCLCVLGRVKSSPHCSRATRSAIFG